LLLLLVYWLSEMRFVPAVPGIGINFTITDSNPVCSHIWSPYWGFTEIGGAYRETKNPSDLEVEIV